MQIAEQLAQEIRKQIFASQNVLIISHRNPDADSIGSNIAMRLILEKIGKKVTSASVDPVAPNCHFLTHAKSFVTDFNPSDFDLFISVDCGSRAQTGFMTKYPQLQAPINLLNIDHHPSNDNFGRVNLVVDNSASATLIIFNLFKIWQEEITPAIATALLAGLYFDTGSFMHSNTNDEVLQAAAELLAYKADKETIIKNLYKQNSIDQMHLWGKVLSEARITDKNIVVSGIKKEDLANCNSTTEQLSGIIDYLSMVKDSRFAALLTEDGKGNIKGSLRTRNNDINLSAIAGNFGGGGHKKASGFTMKGSLHKEVRWLIK